jgi:hypothetical protein
MNDLALEVDEHEVRQSKGAWWPLQAFFIHAAHHLVGGAEQVGLAIEFGERPRRKAGSTSTPVPGLCRRVVFYRAFTISIQKSHQFREATLQRIFLLRHSKILQLHHAIQPNGAGMLDYAC